MKNIFQILIIFFTATCSLLGQNVKINPDLKIDSTYINFESKYLDTESNQIGGIYKGDFTMDNKKVDSLIVSIGFVNITSYWIKIDLTKEQIHPTFIIVTDVPVFNGEYSLEVELQSYSLILNKTKFELNDKLMGKIKGKTKIFDNQQVFFEGQLFHTIGRKMRNNKIKREISDKYKK